MAIATSKTQLGLAIGDTYNGELVVRVFSDGVYGWDDDPSSTSSGEPTKVVTHATVATFDDEHLNQYPDGATVPAVAGVSGQVTGIYIDAGESVTFAGVLETNNTATAQIAWFHHNDTDWEPFARSEGGSDGLRGAPVADIAALTALAARDDETRLAGGVRYTFVLGATTGDHADDAGTGFWSEAPQPTTTYTGMQRIGDRFTPDETEIGNTTFNTGLDLSRATGSLRMQFTGTGENGRPWPVAEIDLEELRENNGAFIWDHDNAYITLSLANAAVGQFSLEDQIRAARFIWAEVVDYAENGFVIPTGTQLVTTRDLAVTSPTATPAISIAEETAGRYPVNVTAGQQLVLGAVTNATVTIEDPIAGWIIAQANGANPTVTFTEEAVPTLPEKLIAYANAGVAVRVGDLEFTMPTAGNRSTMVRAANAAGTGTYLIVNWWSGGMSDHRRVNLNITTGWQRINGGYGFTNAGHKHFFTLTRGTDAYEGMMAVNGGYIGNMFVLEKMT